MNNETHAIANACTGKHASKFRCAIYCMRKIIVFSHLFFYYYYIFPVWKCMLINAWRVKSAMIALTGRKAFLRFYLKVSG